MLRLFFEHTAFDTITDETGETFDNPTETSYTATLDGVPIDLQRFSTDGRDWATVVTDQGTFTATATDYAEDHSEALRRYLERRPSDGWEVAVVDRRQEDGDEWRYTVTITNGRLTERADFVLAPQVVRTLARGADAPTDGQVARQIAQTVRSDDWAHIQQRAQEPTTLMWIAHPS